MCDLKFRRMTADDIECRVGQKFDASTRFLLYKNARVDMKLLDETVGACNWQRDHKELKGNIYCGIGIYVESRKEWVWKWDCGTESNQDPQKGEASDSFKRAGFNWGIGRELYNTPAIYIDNSKLDWSTGGNGRPVLKTHLAVQDIQFDEAGNCTDLVIIDSKSLAVLYSLKKGVPSRDKSATTGANTTTASESKGPENGKKRRVTMQHYNNGKCVNIINRLADYDPDDFAAWTAAINKEELEFEFEDGVTEKFADDVRRIQFNRRRPE